MSNSSQISHTPNNGFLNSSVPAWVVHRSSLLIWFYLMVFLSFIGTVFSVAVIGVILSTKRLRSGSGILILNFLISILLQCGLAMPLMTASVQGVPIGGNSNNPYCRMAMFIFFVLIKVVTLSDMMIGVNRFVAICFPHSYPKWITPSPLTIMVSVPWILSITMAVLLLCRIGGELKSALPWGTCVVTYSDAYTSFLSIFLGALFPVGVLAVAFTVIFGVFIVRWYKNRRSARTKAGPGDQLQRRRARSVRMLFMCYVCYTSCILPMQMASTLFGKAFQADPVLQLTLRAVGLLGYAIVPVICLVLNKDYRQRLLRLAAKIFPFLARRKVRPDTTGAIGTEGKTYPGAYSLQYVAEPD